MLLIPTFPVVPLAQTREEMTELRGMLSSLIDEIRNQRVANQTITNRLDQAERELAEHRAANTRERNQTPLGPLKAASNPQSTGLFDTPEIPSARSGRYIERNDAELKRIHAIVHMATSSAPVIDMVTEETKRTPFTNRIASVRLHHAGKLKFPGICRKHRTKGPRTSFPFSNIECTPHRRRKRGRLLPLLHREPHGGRPRMVSWTRRKLD